jgi:EpsI family protein
MRFLDVSARARGWQWARVVDAGGVALPALFAGGVLWFSVPTLEVLHSRWVDFTYSHGYLVLALAATLIVREWKKQRAVTVLPSGAGLCCFAVCVCGTILGTASTTSIIAELLLPAMWFGAVWTIFGWMQARRFVWPLAYLYFAIPFWDAFNEGLRGLTVAVVAQWVRAASIPAFIEGNQIHIPAGTFEVAGGCSGLHFLIVGAALSAYAGLVHHDRWLSRIVLSLVAIGLSLLANWLRVFSLVAVGHWSDMRHYLIIEDHYYFGWLLFSVCLVPMFLLDRWLIHRQEETTPARAQRGVQVPASRRAVVVGALIVAVLGIWANKRIAGAAENAPGVAASPPALRGWPQAGVWGQDTVPSFPGATSEMAVRFAAADERVDVYLADYRVQRQENEVIFYANRPQGLHSEVATSVDRRVSLASASAMIPIREIEVRDRDGGRRLVWFTMRVAGVLTASDFEAKVWQVIGAIRGRRDAQALVLSTACTVDCAAARSALDRFAAAALPRLLDGSNVAPELAGAK